MSRGGRLGLIAAAVVVAAVLFVVFRPSDDDDSNDDNRPAATEQPARTETGGTGATVRPPHAEPEAERIEVRDGKVQGGVKELKVDPDEDVRFVVTADTADHVHVHGYDLFKDVAPGRPARFKFKANREGVFEIELEDSHTPIAELTVSP